MNKPIPRSKLEHLIWKPGDDAVPQREPEQSVVQPPSTLSGGTYIWMGPASTYAEGVHALREACSSDPRNAHPTFTQDDGTSIIRPLTFRETIEARTNDYERRRETEERTQLFKRWNDSSTGIAYKASTKLFRVVPISKQVVGIDKDFNEAFLPVEYDSLEGAELDSADGSTYNVLLTKDEVTNHPAWRAAVEDDLSLLRTYRDIVFTEKGNPEKAMAFWVLSNTGEDQLKALYVDNLSNISDAFGSSSLSNYGSFLRVAHNETP
jgi:hypothetical protein